jgi:hypothetical protein
LQQATTQARLTLPPKAGCAPREVSGTPSHGAFLGALAAAPFPFLPVPLSCPSKVACEAGPALEEALEDGQE